MNPIGDKKRYVAQAVVAAALACAGCTVLQPRMEAYVPPAVGSTWINGEHNTGSFGSGDKQLTVTVGERTWEGQKVYTLATQPQQGTVVMNGQGFWMAVLGTDDKPLIRWEPASGYQLPLEVGKTWMQHYRMIDAAGGSHPYDTTCKVEAYEEVKVPAGAYKAFKVACSYSYGAEEITWLSPELRIWVKQSLKRAADSAYGAGTQEMELVSQSVRK